MGSRVAAIPLLNSLFKRVIQARAIAAGLNHVIEQIARTG